MKKEKSNHRKIILFIFLGVVITIPAWFIFEFCPGNKPEITSMPPDQLKSVEKSVIQPQAMTGTEQQGAIQTLSNVPPGVKASVIEIVTRQSIEVLRKNFNGLKTTEQKKRKVREIIKDIDQNYLVNENTRKIFSQEFITAAMNVYMKEISAEERALYDPIVRKFIQKMNAYKK